MKLFRKNIMIFTSHHIKNFIRIILLISIGINLCFHSFPSGWKLNSNYSLINYLISQIYEHHHLNPLIKSIPSMFNSLKNCLLIDTILGWLISQRSRLAKIDRRQRKQYLSSLSKFNIAEDLNGFFKKMNHLIQ